MNSNFSGTTTPKTFAISDPGTGLPRIHSGCSKTKEKKPSEKAKNNYLERQKQKEILKNNEILMMKMLDIERTISFPVIQMNEIACRPFQSRLKSKKKKMSEENASFHEKLKKVKSSYNLNRYAKDYEKVSKYFRQSIDGNPAVRTHNKSMKQIEKIVKEEEIRKARLKKVKIV